MSTADFFRSRLDQMIDLRHPLAVLATRLVRADRILTHPGDPILTRGWTPTA